MRCLLGSGLGKRFRRLICFDRTLCRLLDRFAGLGGLPLVQFLLRLSHFLLGLRGLLLGLSRLLTLIPRRLGRLLQRLLGRLLCFAR